EVILSNPPYLPVRPGMRRLGSAAWDGGPDGRHVLDRICRAAAAHLTPGGELVLVQSSLARIGPTMEGLEGAGLDVQILATHTGPLGALAREAAAHMVAAGLLEAMPADEQIVVLSGR